MKKFLTFTVLIVLIFIVGCESPLKIKVNELESVEGSLFNRAELINEDGFEPGYVSGKICSDLVKLSWAQTTAEDFMLYKLLRGNQELAVYNDISQTSFIDSLVNENSSYLYQIVVIAENGMVARDTLTIKTPQWQAPSNLISNGLSYTAVKLTWVDNSDSESGFIIEGESNSGEAYTFSVGANVTEYVIEELDSSEYYTFNVRAFGEFEEDTDFSGSVFFRTSDFYFSAPINLFCEQNFNKTISLSWDDQSTLETGYSISRRINSSTFEEIAEIDSINAAFYLDSDSTTFAIGDMITYKVRAYNDYSSPEAYTEFSNEYVIQFREFDGINENFDDGLANNWIDDGTTRWSVLNGVYQMEGDNNNSRALSYFNEIVSDFTYEADVKKIDGGGDVGLYFRGDGVINYEDIMNGYYFSLGTYYGEYRIYRIVNGSYNSLCSWTNSDAINEGNGVNTLKVVCAGSTMMFYINGEHVATEIDNTFSYGYVGVCAYDDYYSDVVEFDNVLLTYMVEGSSAKSKKVQRNLLETLDNTEVK